MNKLSILLCFITAFLISSCESKSSIKNREVNNQITTLFSKKQNSYKNVEKQLKILTWNIKDLGKTKNIQEINDIVKIINPYDIIAIQEVVAKDPKGAQTVAKIAGELNRKGSKWDYIISEPTNSPSSKMSERYAYFWKTSEVSLVSKPYLDSELKIECVREPYIAEFKQKGDKEKFYIINFHSRVYSSMPEEEIKYFKEYPKRLNSERVIILGDFNLNEEHKIWNDLYELGFKSAIQDSPTTLKKKCKRKKYLYHSIDNIYFDSKHIKLLNSGRIDFVGSCKNLIYARGISDHLPVFLECVID